jgi:hypothetical protein
MAAFYEVKERLTRKQPANEIGDSGSAQSHADKRRSGEAKKQSNTAHPKLFWFYKITFFPN